MEFTIIMENNFSPVAKTPTYHIEHTRNVLHSQSPTTEDIVPRAHALLAPPGEKCWSHLERQCGSFSRS